MEKYAKRVGLDFIVNYVLNTEYQLVFLHAGHTIEAHRKCVEEARPVYTFRCKSGELADIFIAGSSKAAANMWANGTGPNFVDRVTKRGGTVVKLARCPDGVVAEHPDVLKYGYIPYREVKKLVDQGEIKDLAAADHIARSAMRMHDHKLNYILASEGVSSSEAQRLGMGYASTPQKAVDRAFERHGPDARVYVYPGKTFASLIVENNE
jgi:nickel-dependent lactate racemase